MRRALLTGMATGCLAVAMPVAAQGVGQAAEFGVRVDVPGGSLGQVLNAFAASSGVELTVNASLLQGKQSKGLHGTYSVSEGFAELLRGQGLRAVREANGSYTLCSALEDSSVSLSNTTVQASYTRADDLPAAYAGGQVGAGSRIGLLGNQDFMQTPFSAVSYTDEFVRNRQAQDIGAVIGATDPSVYVPTRRSIYETYFIRGLSTTASDVTYNGLIGMAPNMRGSTELAERIELLKGPSVLLNGMPPEGSVAGSINVVPKRAGDDSLTRLTATYESDAEIGVHADVGQRFGEGKPFGIRYNGVYRDGDTAVDNQRHKMELSALGLDWRAERVRLSADIYRQRERMDGVNYFGISTISTGVTQIPSPKKGDYSLAPDWAYTINQTETLMLRAEADLSESASAYAAWGHRDGGYDAWMSRDRLLNNAGDISVLAYRSIREGTQKTAEAGLKGRFDSGPLSHTWSLAATRYSSNLSFRDAQLANYIRTNYYHLDFGSEPVLRGYGAITSQSTARLDSLAMVDTLSLFDDRLQWTVGVRQQQVQSANFDAADLRTSGYKQSRLSPATALLVRLSDEVSLYANYIQGLSQGAVAPSTAQNNGEIMAPYQTRQYETGVKLDLGRFAMTVALFQIDKPGAYTDPISNVFGVYGKQRNRGAEWTFFGEPVPGLRLLGGVSHTRAELVRATNPASEHHQVTGVPEVIAKLSVEYDLASVPGLTLTGNANYTDKRYVTDDNRLALPSYTTFDIGTRYQTRLASRPVTLRVGVQNVANKAYWLGSWNGGDGSGLSGGLGPQRTLLFSSSVDF